MRERVLRFEFGLLVGAGAGALAAALGGLMGGAGSLTGATLSAGAAAGGLWCAASSLARAGEYGASRWLAILVSSGLGAWVGFSYGSGGAAVAVVIALLHLLLLWENDEFFVSLSLPLLFISWLALVTPFDSNGVLSGILLAALHAVLYRGLSPWLILFYLAFTTGYWLLGLLILACRVLRSL